MMAYLRSRLRLRFSRAAVHLQSEGEETSELIKNSDGEQRASEVDTEQEREGGVKKTKRKKKERVQRRKKKKRQKKKLEWRE